MKWHKIVYFELIAIHIISYDLTNVIIIETIVYV